jgi:Rrf2 family protein
MSLNSIVHLSDAALIAVHALAGLADTPGQLVQSKDLAAIIDASESHVAKVMQRLVKAGLVWSVKGPSGGFKLARNAAGISFKEAIEAVDGPLTGDFCPFRTERCHPDNCIFGEEISRHANELVDYLDRRTIADISSHSQRNIQIPSLISALAPARDLSGSSSKLV